MFDMMLGMAMRSISLFIFQCGLVVASQGKYKKNVVF